MSAVTTVIILLLCASFQAADSLTTPSYGGVFNNINDYYSIKATINGITSWGVYSNASYSFHTAIGRFTITNGSGEVIGYGPSDQFKACDPFLLDPNDYIHGYRVIYDDYVFGLAFYTFLNHSYSCPSPLALADSHSDSGVVVYRQHYLSSIYIDAGWVINGIQFEFTSNYITEPICVAGNVYSSLNGIYEYVYFNYTRMTAIYHCADCEWSAFLFGWITPSLNFYWFLGADGNDGSAWNYCYLGNNLNGASRTQYTFDLNDCGEWKTYQSGEWVSDAALSVIACSSVGPSASPTFSPITTFSSGDDGPIDHFIITFNDDQWAGIDDVSGVTVYFTLWWKHVMYTYSIYTPRRSISYTATPDTYSMTGTFLCDAADTKLIIENQHEDAVQISKIKVVTADGNWFGVDSSFCTPFARNGNQDINDSACGEDQTHSSVICVDNQSGDCEPPQQVVYFDFSRPNEWLSTAPVRAGNATNARTKPITCNPTDSPFSTAAPTPSRNFNKLDAYDSQTTSSSAVYSFSAGDESKLHQQWPLTVALPVMLITLAVISALIIYVCRRQRTTYSPVTPEAPHIECTDIEIDSPSLRERAKHIPPISNALCLLITIGDYQSHETCTQKAEQVLLDDIPIERDIQNLTQVFRLLNYTMLPNEGQCSATWTQQRLMKFLQEDVGEALFDQNGELKHDGLIACVSAHGFENHIVTSDKHAIHKDAIHRILSLKYPKIREIPRIFMFDACDGSATMMKATSNVDLESGKHFGLNNLSMMDVCTVSDKNPDFKLVKIQAANIGFQAKYNEAVGSYLLFQFAELLKENMLDGKSKTLGRIFERIQNELHDAGKQQTTNVFNNDTRYVRLMANSMQ